MIYLIDLNVKISFTREINISEINILKLLEIFAINIFDFIKIKYIKKIIIFVEYICVGRKPMIG